MIKKWLYLFCYYNPTVCKYSQSICKTDFHVLRNNHVYTYHSIITWVFCFGHLSYILLLVSYSVDDSFKNPLDQTLGYCYVACKKKQGDNKSSNF